MSAETKSQIREFLSRRFPVAEITDQDDIFSLGFVNSLFAMELVMFVEKTFELRIPNDELSIDNFRSLDSMAALVERLSAVPAGQGA